MSERKKDCFSKVLKVLEERKPYKKLSKNLLNKYNNVTKDAVKIVI